MERVDYSKLDYEVKVEGGKLAPECLPPPTPQDNRALLEEKAKQIAELEKQLDDLQLKLGQEAQRAYDYKALTEERFNKLVNMITQK